MSVILVFALLCIIVLVVVIVSRLLILNLIWLPFSICSYVSFSCCVLTRSSRSPIHVLICCNCIGACVSISFIHVSCMSCQCDEYKIAGDTIQ